MSGLTIEQVRAAKSDEELFELLGAELTRRLPNGRRPTDDFVAELRRLPVGLRAMSSTYELDVSLTLDDLGWHFGNWHHIGLAEETAAGLRELGATRLAEIFTEALRLAREHWDELGQEKWSSWYTGSPLDRALQPLNHEAWEIHSSLGLGLFTCWLAYARAHPERLF